METCDGNQKKPKPVKKAQRKRKASLSWVQRNTDENYRLRKDKNMKEQVEIPCTAYLWLEKHMFNARHEIITLTFHAKETVTHNDILAYRPKDIGTFCVTSEREHIVLHYS
ncbi:hypothetical protein CBL_04746 [Carabus blaptoides fortunei]